MTTIALIAEGLTDQIILENILFECMSFENDPDFNFAQPMRDQSHLHTAPHGGWELVLEYCREHMHDALASNDYVIVQIDTDCGDHENFNLDLAPGGVDKDMDTLIHDTIKVIESKIDAEIIASEGHRIVFAVCVHSIEAWILLCLFGIEKEKNSFNTLRNKCRSNGFGNISKCEESYTALSMKLTKKTIEANIVDESSLMVFFNDFVSKVAGVSLNLK